MDLSDLASDSWTKKKQAYDELAENDMNRATKSQAEAVYQYTLSHDINLFIKRCAKENLNLQEEALKTQSIGSWIEDIDVFLQSGERLPCEVVLYKGVIRKDLNRLFTEKKLKSKKFSQVKGEKFFESAYMSTTIDKDYAFDAIAKNRKFYHEEDSKELDALFCVHVPAGHRVSAVDRMSKLFEEQENIQHEILLPRGQSFVVSDVYEYARDEFRFLCFRIEIL